MKGRAFNQVVLTTLAVMLVGVARADAGTMYVYSCHTPSGVPVGISGWVPTPGVPRSHAFSDCETGPRGALYAQSGSTAPAAWLVSWGFTAAPQTSIVGFAASACFRSFTVPDGPIGIAGMAWPTDRALRPASEAPWTASAPTGCNGGPPYWADSRNNSQRTLAPTPRIHFAAACFVSCTLGTQASVEVSSFRADILDESAPQVSAVRGPLAANLVHTGSEYVEFDVVDAGVGVYHAVAETRQQGQDVWREVATSPIGRARASCVEVDVTAHPYEFDDPQPCPLNVTKARLELNSDLLASGESELRVMVVDASGNRAPVITPRRFIASGPAAPALAAPASAVSLAIDGAARRTASSARAFRIRGRLTDAEQRPLVSASLTVRTRPFFPKAGVAAGDWSVLGQVVTGPDGTFDARIPGGTSRTVEVVRDAGAGFAAAAARVDVVVPAQVAAAVRASRIRNGQSAVFTGRVRGPIPSGGVLVALEVREPGRWIPVATTRRWVRTNGSGRFRLAYRFRRTFQTSTYRFRVVAADDSAFLYSRGVSRTITVRVRP